MNCHQVQSNLSFYLYGELDFATEDFLEEHLGGCAFCQLALQREKAWHASLQSESESVPLELLSECRLDLQARMGDVEGHTPHFERPQRRLALGELLDRLLPTSSASVFGSWARSPWPARMAVASFLLISGFYLGRWEQHKMESLPSVRFSAPMMANVGELQPYTRIRDIEAHPDGQIRMFVDKGEAGQVTGAASDKIIRQFLLIGVRSASDPAVRFDSVERLSGQVGSDIRDALVASVRQDPNAAVRVKALEGLRPFIEDASIRKTLVDVLGHDENAGVRSAAIDMLAPAQPSVSVSPEVLGILQQVLDANPTDEYVRQRSAQMLRRAHPLQEDATY